MENSKWILVILFATYLLHEAFTLFPQSEVEYRLFPFNQEQLITVRFWVYLACKYAVLTILMAIIYQLSDSHKDILKMFVVFQFLELIEYFLTYNKSLFHIPVLTLKVGINITNIKVVTMFVLVSTKIITTWKPGK
jgi:hypothetical protein